MASPALRLRAGNGGALRESVPGRLAESYLGLPHLSTPTPASVVGLA